jgi:ATP-dependent protease ClpP protease subunit
MQSRKHTINTIGYGMAASMGGVILQVGTTRAMGSNALMLLHEGSMGAIGDFGKVEDRVALMKLMHQRILALFVERSNVSKRFITSKSHRTDWYLTADECLKHSFVDTIR